MPTGWRARCRARDEPALDDVRRRVRRRRRRATMARSTARRSGGSCSPIRRRWRRWRRSSIPPCGRGSSRRSREAARAGALGRGRRGDQARRGRPRRRCATRSGWSRARRTCSASASARCRRGSDPADAEARIAAQADLTARLRPAATRILDTSGTRIDPRRGSGVEDAWTPRSRATGSGQVARTGAATFEARLRELDEQQPGRRMLAGVQRRTTLRRPQPRQVPEQRPRTPPAPAGCASCRRPAAGSAPSDRPGASSRCRRRIAWTSRSRISSSIAVRSRNPKNMASHARRSGIVRAGGSGTSTRYVSGGRTRARNLRGAGVSNVAEAADRRDRRGSPDSSRERRRCDATRATVSDVDARSIRRYRVPRHAARDGDVLLATRRAEPPLTELVADLSSDVAASRPASCRIGRDRRLPQQRVWRSTSGLLRMYAPRKTRFGPGLGSDGFDRSGDPRCGSWGRCVTRVRIWGLRHHPARAEPRRSVRRRARRPGPSSAPVRTRRDAEHGGA